MKPGSTIPITRNESRGGLDLHFDLDFQSAVAQNSCEWRVAGRCLQFVALAPNTELPLDAGTHFAKVVVGRLENINQSCFTEPFAVRSTRLAVDRVVAGAQGALFALVSETPETPDKITAMSEVQFQGPSAENLVWESFDSKFGQYLDRFKGLDCHMMTHLHLLNHRQEEVANVNFWTCGKGVDLSTHNHAQAPTDMAPAFAEVHWVVDAGTDTSGMYQTASPDGHPRTCQYLTRGDEHGPYFMIDSATQKPARLENGAVDYGWHGWQAGSDGHEGQAYDLVAAFEINPDFASL